MNFVKLIPAPLHRLAYRGAHGLRRLWFETVGGTLHGCSILAQDADGRFVLVRHSYGRPVWAFPGGSMGRGEPPIEAALREFREELGCDLLEPRLLAVVEEPYLGATNIVHVVTGRIGGEPQPDRREILEARAFVREEFPRKLGRTVEARMRVFDAACGHREGPSQQR